jgi:CDP-glycerol glycerophosphotransferase (TagB/SpsB family)
VKPLKKMNFIYYSRGYDNVLDSLIDPICIYLQEDEYQKTYDLDGTMLNINFFKEKTPRMGVFISHGIADKNWRNANSMVGYDYIFVSGMSWRDKLLSQRISKNKIFITGYTKLDPIFNGEYTKQTYEKPVVLYAPTHKAIPNVSIAGRFEKYLSQLEDEYHIIVAGHPAININNNNKPTLQALVDADVVISDCSSIVYEAWALGKPVIFPDWLVKDHIISIFRDSFEAEIYKKELGLHANNIDNLKECIHYSLNYPLEEAVIVFMEGIFPQKLRGASGKVTAETLIKIANKI